MIPTTELRRNSKFTRIELPAKVKFVRAHTIEGCP
jgi:hypothetical protein